MINMLLLRLVNNIAVNDVYSAEGMWREGVINRIIDAYAAWISNDNNNYNNNNNNRSK